MFSHEGQEMQEEIWRQEARKLEQTTPEEHIKKACEQLAYYSTGFQDRHCLLANAHATLAVAKKLVKR